MGAAFPPTATSPPGLKDEFRQRGVGGSALRSGKPHQGSKWPRSTLTEGAHAAARSKGTYLAARYARLKGRRGPKRATVAVGPSILVSAYHVLERNRPTKSSARTTSMSVGQAYAKRPVRQLERLGHKVTLAPLVQSV